MTRFLKPSAATVSACADALSRGAAIIYPTETVYGLGVDALNEEAVEKLFSIKGRDPKKPISIALPNIESIEWYAELNEKARLLAQKFLPGPLTLVLKLKTDLHWLTSNGKIGIRIPKNEFASDLLRGFGRPITATSANISGMESAADPDHMDKELVEKVEIFVKDSIVGYGKVSTVIDISGTPRILREGAISTKRISFALKNDAPF